MNKKSIFFLSLLTVLIIVLSLSTTYALAAGDLFFATSFSPQQQVSSPTPIPLVSPSIPPDRVLPPVGSNAGLLIGVSVLVLIIIGGVVWSSRWGKKH